MLLPDVAYTIPVSVPRRGHFDSVILPAEIIKAPFFRFSRGVSKKRGGCVAFPAAGVV